MICYSPKKGGIISYGVLKFIVVTPHPYIMIVSLSSSHHSRFLWKSYKTIFHLQNYGALSSFNFSDFHCALPIWLLLKYFWLESPESVMIINGANIFLCFSFDPHQICLLRLDTKQKNIWYFSLTQMKTDIDICYNITSAM